MSRRAAIDVGSTTVRWLVTDGARPLVRRSVTTGLGAALAHSTEPDPDALARTRAALAGAADDLRRHDVHVVRAVVTSPGRRTSDPAGLCDQLSAALGVEVSVLAAEDEASFGFIGATTGLGVDPAAVAVVDVGGGSIGVATATGRMSLPVGVHHAAAVTLASDPPRAADLTNAIGLVDDHLDDLLRELPDVAGRPVVGIGGTIRTIAAVELGLADGPEVGVEPSPLHGMVLTRDAAEDVFRTLATEAFADRIHNPGLPVEWADAIVGGCCAVVAVMRRLRLDDLVVSTHDLLEGLLTDSL